MQDLIPHFNATGTHYEIGFYIGKEFENRIKRYFELFTDFKDCILPLIASDYGNKIVGNFLKNLNIKFPWYVDEMRGLAKGANIPFEHILALNLRVELMHIIKHKSECKILIDQELEDLLLECSDFTLSNEENRLILHNEDASIAIYDTGYIVSCKIISQDYGGVKSPNEEFTCYCYPGHLPGNAFAFNSSGFTFSVDALLPKLIALNRFPRQIVSRYMLSAKTLRDLESIILNTPIAYGFCLILGYFGEDKSALETDWNSEYFEAGDGKDCIETHPVIWNYELAPNESSDKISLVSKHCVIPKNSTNSTSGFYSLDYCYHFNHYERVKIDECVVNSSRHRRARADEFDPPKHLRDLLNMAYDDKDEQYPIYRVKENYQVQCIATAVFDLKEKKLCIYNGRVAKYEPFITIRMNT